MPWQKLSIAKKLYIIVGVMAVLIASELFVLRFSLGKLSAVRAFVGGEGLWSKAQKNAVFRLQAYASSHDQNDYNEYLSYLDVPQGDHLARAELEKPHPDLEKVRHWLEQGRIDPHDTGPMIDLLQHYYWVSFIERAIGHWREGDRLLEQLRDSGDALHTSLSRNPPDLRRAAEITSKIRLINQDLTVAEEKFSNVLGDGSRWLEKFVISFLSLGVLMIESIGLTLTIKTTRRITRGLEALNKKSETIGRGDFSNVSDSAPVEQPQSGDEIDQLSLSLDQMGRMLKRSYMSLEARVAERTKELAEMAHENARLYDQANSALQSRDEFLSIAAHELKTPLTALSLQVELAERSAREANPDSEKIREKLRKTLHHVKKLRDLIEDLLDLARIRSGKLELHFQDCDLSQILRESIAQFTADAAQKGIFISVQADPSIVGNWDPVRMGQVITNLISNALKYGESKPIEISLSKKAGMAELSVKDYGRGISEEQQTRIFDKFERVGEKTQISGLGLGLYIVRQILEAHRGSITVVSEIGKGSCFVARVPLKFQVGHNQ